VVVIVAADGDRRVVSEPFVVGSAGDAIDVRGTVTSDGVECTAVRGPGGALYTLAGGAQSLSAGVEVRVRGTIAGPSICQQGTTIDVKSIERM
jgi:hypothetical protein